MIENGPRLWDKMLRGLDLPGAVVAGGCIRDFFLTIPPKDIDVFVPCKDMDDWCEKKYALLERVAGVSDLLDTQEGREYENTDFSKEKNPLYGVLEGDFMDYRINIIARTNHTSNAALIEFFDFGCVQACYGGDAVEYTEANRVDIMTHRATLTHDKHIPQSLERFYRFNKRHPGLLSLNLPFAYGQDELYFPAERSVLVDFDA